MLTEAVLFEIHAAWGILSAVSSVLTLAAGVAAVLALVSIWRMQRDARTIEAAQNFAAVDLTTVVKRYVPAEQQTNVARDEIAIAKQAIVTRRPRLKRIAVIFGMAFVCGATATVFTAHRRLGTTATARLTAQPRVNLDVLKNIQGVWGWRADFLQSCSENPQTIQVAADRKTLTIHYTKPYKQGSKTITDLTFDVISVKQDMLVLLRADPPTDTKPIPADVTFIDANTMSWSPRNNAMMWSGAIERCARARQ
jgi:hypothetical protein